jgi:hypothetical protein
MLRGPFSSVRNFTNRLLARLRYTDRAIYSFVVDADPNLHTKVITSLDPLFSTVATIRQRFIYNLLTKSQRRRASCFHGLAVRCTKFNAWRDDI